MDTGTTAFMLCCIIGLTLMIPGLALFYGGMVRRKNVIATVAQSFAITCLISVLWMVIGYSLAFGDGNAYIGDFSKFMLSGIAAKEVGTPGARPHVAVRVVREVSYLAHRQALRRRGGRELGSQRNQGRSIWS